MVCRFLGYSNHEKAYRFEKLSSGRLVVSRDVQYMEDTFDSGKRTQVGSNAVGLSDNHEDFDDAYGYSGGNTSDHDMGGQPSVAVTTPQQSVAPRPLSERPQCQ